MSYPPDTYHGTGGEPSAVLHPHDAAPDITNLPSNDVHYLANGHTTGGQFGLYRWTFGPKASGPKAHFHRGISESFYILDGTVRLFNGERWVDATAGDFLYVPQGGIHAFRNESGAPAAMLLLFTPGAPREEYFETLADIAQGRRARMSPAERAEFMLRHDTYWLDEI
jgi:mannose-6-phosphate isomerase-like protein (cupin superfamily)